MLSKCPLCGQSLPHALDHDELQSRIQKLSTPALAAARKKLREDYDARLEAAVEKNQRAADRQLQTRLREVEVQARQNAERAMSRQMAAAEKRVADAENKTRLEVDRARREAEARAKKDMAQAIHIAKIQGDAKVQKIQAERERERIREEAKAAKLQGELDDLSRRLENQSGEQLGAEAERDLLTELRNAFPTDKFEKFGRGVKGADILHLVMDGSKESGKIV
jgi:hypothetical protein